MKIGNENNPIRQHHVPQVYLKNFCNSQNSITVINKREHRVFTTGIRAVAVENDFYTLKKLNDPYCWERAYASSIEPLMGKLFSKLISHTSVVVQNNATVMTTVEKMELSIIMVVQLLRGKQSRKYEQKLYKDLLPETIQKASALFSTLSNEQKGLLQALEIDDFYFKRVAMDVSLNFERIKKYSEILCARDFLFCRIQGDMEFATSDNPVMFINSITSNACPFANGLAMPGTLVYYPIAPKILLCAVHPSAYFQILSKQDCHLIDLNATKEKNFILSINEKQIEQCSQHAFARSVSTLKPFQR